MAQDTNLQESMREIAVAYSAAPMPLEACLGLRRRLGDLNPSSNLLFELAARTTKDALVQDAEIRDLLSEQQLGGMAITASALNCLVAEMQQARPQVILEFGSGISTLVSAYLLRKWYGWDGQVRLFSIDQEERFLQNTRQMLEAHQLLEGVRFLSAPLAPQQIDGSQYYGYHLPAGVLEGFFEDVQPDFVVIDGPFGNYGVRASTIPSVQRHLSPGALILMDDALRDGELAAAHWWHNLGYVRVDGIVWAGKGVLRGRFQRAAQHGQTRELLTWLALSPRSDVLDILPHPAQPDLSALSSRYGPPPNLQAAAENAGQALIAEGIRHFSQGNLLRARQIFETAHRFSPESPDILVSLGKTGLALGQSGLALRCFRRAVQINGSDIDAWIGLGLVAKENNLHDLLSKAVNAVGTLQPGHPVLQKLTA